MSKEGEPEVTDTRLTAPRETVIVHVPRITPRTLPGLANTQNKGAIDWGGHGLLAYGSNYTVVIIDTKNVQVVQCLDRHKAMVKKVLWGKDYLRHDRLIQSKPQIYGSIDLVSSDATGHIIIWDVTLGEQVKVLQEDSKPILDMNWVTQWDGNKHILAALHSPCLFILWDTISGTKIWKKTYNETLVAFNFDPFHPSKMAFQCSDCILFVEDFTIAKVPSSGGRKFYVSSPRAATRNSSGNLSVGKGSLGNVMAAIQEEKTGAKDRFRRLMKDMVIGEIKPKHDDGMMLSECLQVTYHRSMRHHILLLYPREILLLDLHVNQTVGFVPIGEKLSSPYLQIYSCKQRNIFYCLHENGCVSAKIKKKMEGSSSPIDAPASSIASLEMNSDGPLEMSYDHICSSEAVRQTRGLQVLGMAVNPVSETKIAIFLNTGKIISVEFFPEYNRQSALNFSPNSVVYPRRDGIQRCQTLSDIIPPLFGDFQLQSLKLRLLVMGILPSVAAPITALRMCPAITTRNWQQYSPLLAGGTTGGLIQIYNAAMGCIEKELAVHSYTVRGIEWTGLKTFLSYAFPNISNTSSSVRNELYHTDILTGESTLLRTDRGEEAPVEMLRVSPLKQYFIVVISNGPVELWDLKSKQLIKVMPKKFPVVTALEWSPPSSSRSIKRNYQSKEETVVGDVANSTAAKTPDTPSITAAQTPNLPPLEKQEFTDKIISKEYFVFADSDSQLYRFTVDGHLIDGVRISPESGSGTVTCIAFKAEQIVQGDAGGLISVWDLRTGQTRRHSTSRGFIKKLRFAPGKGNMKLLVLYNDGVDVIDLKGASLSSADTAFEKIGQLKSPRDMVKVLDIDWASSDKPVLTTQDGCLRIMDMTLIGSSSPISDYEFQNPIFCPALLPSEVAFKVRERLCWQPPDLPYTTQLTVEHGFTDNQITLINEQLCMVEKEQLECLRKPQFQTAERCLIVAQIFGDDAEIDLWTVTLYYLQISKAKAKTGGNLGEKTAENSVFPVEFESKKSKNSSPVIPLDSCYDVLQDSNSYQKLQFERLAIYDSKRTDYEQTKRVIQQQLLLGQSDRAVQLLLETDLNSPEYYTDAIKACLVATVQSTSTAQSTIKLVATNLIAQGSIWEGVQLLCLIGKGLDACRYLTSYSRWGAAVWLARAVLPPQDANEVIKKWADHLFTQGFKEKAVLVLICLEQWYAAHSMLSIIDPRKASLLAQACQEFDIRLTEQS